FGGLSKVRFSETSIGIPGDVNGDMLVDEADFQIINGSMFQTVTGGVAAGDLNQDTFVDFYDYKSWKNIVDSQPPAAISGTNTTPEPGSLSLVLGAIAVAGLGRGFVSRRRGSKTALAR